MSGLILKLRPHEELMINGVVVENGDRKTRLRVKTEGAHILRLRDALKPEQATTPLERAYYIAQMAVGGMLAPAEASKQLARALDGLAAADAGGIRRDVARHVAENDYYKAMRALGALMARQAGAANRANGKAGSPAAAQPDGAAGG